MRKNRFTYGEISSLCLELALFLHAGAGVGDGLALLAGETTTPWMRSAFERMAESVDEGGSLSDAFEQSGLFPGEVARMLRVGEQTGHSENTLRSLSRYYARQDEMDRQMHSALLYPSILVLVMLAVIVVLLTQVMPIFNDVYASLGGELTGFARGLLRLGEGIDAALPVILVIMVPIAVLLAVFASSQSVRQSVMQRLLGKGKKGIAGKMSTARFAEALEMAIASGLTAEEAVAAAGEVLADDERCKKCLERIASGEKLADAMRGEGLLPAAECRLLELGLASGSGETAMTEITRRMSRDAEDSLERLVGRIEPALVVVTSVMVGAILLAVMLPLANIMTAIG